MAIRTTTPVLTFTLHVTFNLHVNIDEMTDLPPDGTELMRMFLPASPFVSHLGITIEELREDQAALRLPWQECSVTVGDMVHGGAIAALADVAVMAAAWCGRRAPERLRGVTTSLSVEFISSAHSTDLIARGRVLRRGGTLTSCEVDIVAPDGALVAKALGNYKVG